MCPVDVINILKHMSYMKWHLADVIVERLFIKFFITSIFIFLFLNLGGSTLDQHTYHVVPVTDATPKVDRAKTKL